jgi:hypothetical protein
MPAAAAASAYVAPPASSAISTESLSSFATLGTETVSFEFSAKGHAGHGG